MKAYPLLRKGHSLPLRLLTLDTQFPFLSCCCCLFAQMFAVYWREVLRIAEGTAEEDYMANFMFKYFVRTSRTEYLNMKLAAVLLGGSFDDTESFSPVHVEHLREQAKTIGWERALRI